MGLFLSFSPYVRVWEGGQQVHDVMAEPLPDEGDCVSTVTGIEMS